MIKIKYSTRLVILIAGIVLKFPLSRIGYLQCKNEKRMWVKYKHLNILGELHWEWNGIICMKRYNPTNVDKVCYNRASFFQKLQSILLEEKNLISKTEAHRFIDIVLYTKQMMPEFDIDKCDLYKAENWGKSGDDYVLIDYGINNYISGLY